MKQEDHLLCHELTGTTDILSTKPRTPMKKSVPQLIEYYKSWLSKYPFVSIEVGALMGLVDGAGCHFWETFGVARATDFF